MKVREMLAVGTAVASLALVVGLTARPVAAAERKGPCAADIEKLCAGVPHGGAIKKCLREHQAELSAACQARIEKAKGKRGARRKACKDDAAKFCKDVPRGGGQLLQCLTSHESELSAACRASLANRSPKRK